MENDLRSLGFDVRVASGEDRVAAEVAAVPAGARVALVDPRFVGHRHSLRLALTDPRFPAAAAPGALTVAPQSRAALTRALGAPAVDSGPSGLASAAAEEVAAAPSDAARGGVAAAPGDTAVTASSHAPRTVPDELADALKAQGVPVHRPDLGALVATVPAGEEARAAAQGDVDSVDDEAVRLRSAVKSRDGFFTTFCVSPYSRYIARWCARRGLTPNQVTTASLITALIAAACAATGERGGFVAAGVLLIASFVLDATDGQLARYDLQYSTLGAWLDATFDRAKEYAYYAGLALGAARGGEDVWGLALGAMVLQTVRHVVDFSFNEANHDAQANTSPTAALSSKLDSVGWTVWLRRMIILPIGERWALIAVLTACTTPRITFIVLLAGCALAACYTTAGRVLRSLTRPQPSAGALPARRTGTDRAARALADLADSGPLACACAALAERAHLRLGGFARPAVALLGALVLLATALWTPPGSVWLLAAAVLYVLTSALAVTGPLRGALDWLVPPFFRTAEYVLVLVLAVLAARDGADGAVPAAFGLVAAVAYHHYDTVYRIRGGTGAPPNWLVRATGGHEGRSLAVTLAAVLWLGGDSRGQVQGQGFTIALTALAVVIAAVVLVESIRFWVSSKAPAVHDETGEPA